MMLQILREIHRRHPALPQLTGNGVVIGQGGAEAVEWVAGQFLIPGITWLQYETGCETGQGGQGRTDKTEQDGRRRRSYLDNTKTSRPLAARSAPVTGLNPPPAPTATARSVRATRSAAR